MRAEVKRSFGFHATLLLIYGTLFAEFLYITMDQTDCTGKTLMFLQLFQYSFLGLACVSLLELMYLFMILCGCASEGGFARGDFWFGVLSKLIMFGQYVLVGIGTAWFATDDNDCDTVFTQGFEVHRWVLGVYYILAVFIVIYYIVSCYKGSDRPPRQTSEVPLISLQDLEETKSGANETDK
jgi:hypothetical protein